MHALLGIASSAQALKMCGGHNRLVCSCTQHNSSCIYLILHSMRGCIPKAWGLLPYSKRFYMTLIDLPLSKTSSPELNPVHPSWKSCCLYCLCSFRLHIIKLSRLEALQRHQKQSQNKAAYSNPEAKPNQSQTKPNPPTPSPPSPLPPEPLLPIKAKRASKATGHLPNGNMLNIIWSE